MNRKALTYISLSLRINDWEKQIRKNYAQSNGPIESITWGVTFDYTLSQANVEIKVIIRKETERFGQKPQLLICSIAPL